MIVPTATTGRWRWRRVPVKRGFEVALLLPLFGSDLLKTSFPGSQQNTCGQPMQGGPLARPNGGYRHGPRPALFGKCIVAGLANNGGNSGRPNQDDPMERTIAFQVLRTVEKLIFAANDCRECVDSVADFDF